jgi:DNA (cytosine-5)-methyltransferase 1
MTTITTLFSGGEGVGIGARAAGITHLDGFEHDNDIAQVARDNGFNVHAADVMTIDPHTLRVPDILHCSPVCTRASVANQSAELNEDGTKEAPLDIEFGSKIAQFIDVMQPRCFTLENVYQYRNFNAFKIICAGLNRNGYMWDYDNLNSADYGVPQTRRRLVLRAIRDSLLPNFPQPVRWVGWYEAIEDLIPGLPTAWHSKKNQPCEWDTLGRPCRKTEGICRGHFAEWQELRLPEDLLQSYLIAGGNTQKELITSTARLTSAPAPTVFADIKNNGRAFILDCQENSNQTGVTIPNGNASMFTVTSGKGSKQPLRAFIIAGQNMSNVTTRSQGEPSFTLRTLDTGGRFNLAWLSQGRIVSMTYQALARLQSFPNSYHWTDNKKMNVKIIGNSVPPLLYEGVIAPMVSLLR